MIDLRLWISLCESVEFSEYGYWVTPTGEAIVVPDSSHYKILLHHYHGIAKIRPDRYGEVIAEGWCWVTVSGTFLCFIDPQALTRQSVLTLLQIINQYNDFEDFRFVFVDHGFEHFFEI